MTSATTLGHRLNDRRFAKSRSAQPTWSRDSEALLWLAPETIVVRNSDCKDRSDRSLRLRERYDPWWGQAVGALLSAFAIFGTATILLTLVA